MASVPDLRAIAAALTREHANKVATADMYYLTAFPGTPSPPYFITTPPRPYLPATFTTERASEPVTADNSLGTRYRPTMDTSIPFTIPTPTGPYTPLCYRGVSPSPAASEPYSPPTHMSITTPIALTAEHASQPASADDNTMDTSVPYTCPTPVASKPYSPPTEMSIDSSTFSPIALSPSPPRPSPSPPLPLPQRLTAAAAHWASMRDTFVQNAKFEMEWITANAEEGEVVEEAEQDVMRRLAGKLEQVAGWEREEAVRGWRAGG